MVVVDVMYCIQVLMTCGIQFDGVSWVPGEGGS